MTCSWIISDVRKVGHTSLITFHRMIRLRDSEIAAECEMTSVYFDLIARISHPLPDMIRERTAMFIGG